MLIYKTLDRVRFSIGNKSPAAVSYEDESLRRLWKQAWRLTKKLQILLKDLWNFRSLDSGGKGEPSKWLCAAPWWGVMWGSMLTSYLESGINTSLSAQSARNSQPATTRIYWPGAARTRAAYGTARQGPRWLQAIGTAQPRRRRGGHSRHGNTSGPGKSWRLVTK